MSGERKGKYDLSGGRKKKDRETEKERGKII